MLIELNIFNNLKNDFAITLKKNQKSNFVIT